MLFPYCNILMLTIFLNNLCCVISHIMNSCVYRTIKILAELNWTQVYEVLVLSFCSFCFILYSLTLGVDTLLTHSCNKAIGKTSWL